MHIESYGFSNLVSITAVQCVCSVVCNSNITIAIFFRVYHRNQEKCYNQNMAYVMLSEGPYDIVPHGRPLDMQHREVLGPPGETCQTCETCEELHLCQTLHPQQMTTAPAPPAPSPRQPLYTWTV